MSTHGLMLLEFITLSLPLHNRNLLHSSILFVLLTTDTYWPNTYAKLSAVRPQ